MGSSAILAVGGAEDKVDKRDILDRFVLEAGGERARIAILPTASEIPEERAAFYTQVFAEIGAGEAFHVPIVTREDAESTDHAARIYGATGVFLTGGDQSRLVQVLKGTRSFAALERRLREKGVLAGTSAGASAFSTTMILGGSGGIQLRRDGVRLGPGLGLITRLIIDQHFSQRDRMGRLLAAVAQEPNRLGVGIDEDTAIVYYGNGNLEIIGSGQVFVVDASGARSRGREAATGPFSLSGVTLHVLNPGDRFDVPGRKVRLAARG
jgi:cyanophycinase